MVLKYFKITDTLDELKQKRNELAKKYHPDRYTEPNKKEQSSKIMALINTEYDFILKNYKHLTKEKLNSRYQTVYNNSEAKQQATAIFHALTNRTGVDKQVLIKTISEIKNFEAVYDLYGKQYSISTIAHVVKQIKDPQLQKSIIDLLESARAFKRFSNIFSNVFK